MTNVPKQIREFIACYPNDNAPYIRKRLIEKLGVYVSKPIIRQVLKEVSNA